MELTTSPNTLLTVFSRGFTIVFLVSVNTIQISGHHFLGGFLVGGLISWCWWSNAHAAGLHDRPYAAHTYALGAACGTLSGMFLMRLIYG